MKQNEERCNRQKFRQAEKIGQSLGRQRVDGVMQKFRHSRNRGKNRKLRRLHAPADAFPGSGKPMVTIHGLKPNKQHLGIHGLRKVSKS